MYGIVQSWHQGRKWKSMGDRECVMGDLMVRGIIQLPKGHGLDDRKSHRVSINNRVSCQMVLEADPERLSAHLVQVHEW